MAVGSLVTRNTKTRGRLLRAVLPMAAMTAMTRDDGDSTFGLDFRKECPSLSFVVNL